MKKTSQQMITRFNTLLETHNQKIRLIEYTGNSVLLSSGILLENDAKRKFCKRIVNNKTNLWITNVDKLLSGEITEREIKARLSSIGGKSVQQQYGNLIRKIVLLSGDGNLDNKNANFRDTLFAALRNNWHVEVWSWKSSCSDVYQRIAMKNIKYAKRFGITEKMLDRFKLIYLDDYREQIIFTKCFLLMKQKQLN